MHRLFLIFFSAALFTSAAFADDNVRAAQIKLKESGFYFGAVDGKPSTDFSAAVTRYQIRNGLQITGNLDAETSKALGVTTQTAANQPPSGATSETWRRLRKTDRRFLAGRTTQSAPAPTQTASVTQSNRSATSVLRPAESGGANMVLSPDRLRDYVAAFVLAGLDPQIGSELEFFGDRVSYYGDGVVGREKIRGDLQRYNARWPQRRFWLAGDLNVTPQADSRLRVTFPLRYELRNGAKHSSGKIRKTLLLEVHGDDLQIVGVNERKA